MSREPASTTGVWDDADRRDRRRTSAAAAQPRHPGRHDRKDRGPRNTEPIPLSAHVSQPPAPHLVDDLPDAVPVSAQELDVIETYLGAVLNEFLGARE